MGFFSSSPKIGRPVAKTATSGDINFPGTTIWIRSAIIPATNTDYVPTVMQHLNDIQSFTVGRSFLTSLSGFGKKQVIKYAGQNVNQAAGGGTSSYKLLRRHHDKQDRPLFATELQATITASRHDKKWLAEQLHKTELPTWAGTNAPSPFKSIPRPAQALTGGHKPLPLTPVQVNELEIDQWLAGTKLPSRDEMDVLMLVLEPWLSNGGGASSLVSYDPHKVMVSGTSRPPQVALFHELIHCYYNAMGGQLGREDSIQETNGGRLFELMAVGLGPFANSPYNENKFRTAIGVGLRGHYP